MNRETEIDLITVIAIKEMLPEAVVAMTKHGCNIAFHDTCCEVRFPVGTVREEIIPRMLHSVRYNVMLPNGFFVMQVWVRHLEMSIFYYQPERERT